MYTPANRDKGASVNLGLAEKFYINPLKKSLDKQVKLEIVAGYHSHGVPLMIYILMKIYQDITLLQGMVRRYRLVEKNQQIIFL